MQLDSEVLDGLEAFYGVEFGGASMGGWAVGWVGLAATTLCDSLTYCLMSLAPHLVPPTYQHIVCRRPNLRLPDFHHELRRSLVPQVSAGPTRRVLLPVVCTRVARGGCVFSNSSTSLDPVFRFFLCMPLLYACLVPPLTPTSSSMHMLPGPNGPRVLPVIVHSLRPQSAASKPAVLKARSCKPTAIGLAEAEQRPCRASQPHRECGGGGTGRPACAGGW